MHADFDFDPFDPGYWDDPYPSYRVMRHEQPVYRRPTPFGRCWPHYWMLSRAADVNAALADWRTFSSAEGVLVDTDRTVLNPDQPPLLFDADPPRHDEIRSVLSRVLTTPRVTGLEPHVRQYAKELVSRHKASGSFDASTQFGQLIPTITMCALLDLPTSEREQFLEWNLDTLGGNDFASEAAKQAWAEMGEYWVDVVKDRRTHPSTDLISQIVRVQEEGGIPISDQEISAFCGLLHDASQNTTMNMITLAVVSLARYPDQRRKLAANPDLWPGAIEELLRFVSPVQGLCRTTTRDVTLHGTTIHRGEQVLLLFGSANHDETVFADPDVLNVDREVKNHWTFGHGLHHCLGSAVAKLETRVAVQVLLEEVGDWDVAGPIERTQLVPTRGGPRRLCLPPPPDPAGPLQLVVLPFCRDRLTRGKPYRRLPSRLCTARPHSAITSRLTRTWPVTSGPQSHSAMTDSTISSIDSIWSGRRVLPTSSLAPSLSTAARGSTVFTRIPVPYSSAARPLVSRLSAAFDAP